MEKFVYVATHTVRHEGSEVISIHETVEGANAVAKAKYNNLYQSSPLGNGRKSRIKSDGTFYGTVFDSTVSVDKKQLKD